MAISLWRFPDEAEAFKSTRKSGVQELNDTLKIDDAELAMLIKDADISECTLDEGVSTGTPASHIGRTPIQNLDTSSGISKGGINSLDKCRKEVDTENSDKFSKQHRFMQTQTIFQGLNTPSTNVVQKKTMYLL